MLTYVEKCCELFMLNQCTNIWAELKRQSSGQDRVGISPSFASCLEQIAIFGGILLNKRVCLALRLQWSDAVVSAASIFGLPTSPWTAVCLQKLGVALRSILQRVAIHVDQSWRDIMVQINHKLAIANILFPMEGWEARLFRLTCSMAS